MAKNTDTLAVTNHMNISARMPVKVLTDDYTIKDSESGYLFMIGTDAKTITLPLAKTVGPGFTVAVMNIGADANNIVTISPNSADGIYGTIANAAADSVSGGVDNKDIVNTKATANKGDYIVLVSDGDTGWFIFGGVGIWASEA
jgi:hypothetical protein